MEVQPVVVLPPSAKRKTNFSLCVVCQSANKDLRNATEFSLEKFKDAFFKRKSFCDSTFEALLYRLQDELENLDHGQVKWHRSCYANFTNKVNIQLVEKKFNKKGSMPIAAANSGAEDEITSDHKRISRSTLGNTNYDECIFCQKRKKNKGLFERLAMVQTIQYAEKLTYFASEDDTLQRRLGILDPIASEIKYHPSCSLLYDRKFNLTTTNQKSLYDIAFSKLLEIIDDGFKSGHVYSLSDLSEQYNVIASSFCNENITYRPKLLLHRIKDHYKDNIEIVEQHKKNESVLLFPKLSVNAALYTIKLLCKQHEENEPLSSVETNATVNEEQLMSRMFYHVAQKIKHDLSLVKGIEHNITNINKEAAAGIVPESLQMLLNLILKNENKDKEKLNNQILSIGQDILFAFNGSLTPKHVGLGLTIHQATRSKKLIAQLHASGNSINYDTVRRIETALANHAIKKCDDSILMPENLKENRFTHFAVDNIDILEETLDGQGTFHGTQVIAFQRGLPQKSNNIITLQSPKALNVPPNLIHVPSAPVINKPPIKLDVIKHPETENADKRVINCRDMTWLLCRSVKKNNQIVPSWKQMNKVISEKNRQISTIGYTPIMTNPAHEIDTLTAVLHRCKEMTNRLGQKYTVITADEALYCKLKQIQWHSGAFSEVVVRLGGFHLCLNFLKAIGKRFSGSGLPEMWTESNVFGESTALNVMEAKHYNRAIRALKLTFEALWRTLMPKLIDWATENNKVPIELLEEIKLMTNFKEPTLDLLTTWQSLESKMHIIFDLLEEFDSYNQKNSLYQYWRSYLDLASLVLKFIRAEREGDWNLHLEAVSQMLPWFFVYDRINYARWGSIYLADMETLNETAPEVYKEFSQGNFVVKETKKSFNEISPDLALEHVNKVHKIAGGLIGITKKDTARDRWCLLFNARSQISVMTAKLFDLECNEIQEEQSESATSKKDEEDINKLAEMFEKAKIFEQDNKKLINIYTGETASDDIVNDLLNANTRGIELSKEFKSQRFIEKAVDFYSPIKKVNSKTLNDLYKLKVTTSCGKQTLSVNSNLLIRHMLSAVKSGRDLDLKNVLQNELRDPPPSLFDENGELRQCQKSALANVLIAKVKSQTALTCDQKSTAMVIDGQAVVQKIGKPKNAKTFGDLAKEFIKSVTSPLKSKECSSVHVIFDRYNEISIKCGTRTKRKRSVASIEYKVMDDDTQLPKKWDRFIHNEKNKANLANYLSLEISKYAATIEEGLELLTSGGFEDQFVVKTNLHRNTDHLASSHEEADTRFILHAIDASQMGFETLIINSRDTDVLLLLTHFYEKLPKNVWIQFGTSLKPKYVPIHEIVDTLGEKKQNLLAFHALTGCDTTSSLSGYAKLSCWKVFEQNHNLLDGIGSAIVLPENLEKAEKFIILIYSDKNQSLQCIDNIDHLRAAVFHNINSLEKLPPTKGTLKYHIYRANYQALIWKSADNPKPLLPPPEECGWHVEEMKLLPIKTTKPPISLKDLAFISCQCKTACRNSRCGCVNKGQKCIVGVCHVGQETCQNHFNFDTTE